MSKDTSGAQKRIEKALIHNLLSQSQMGHSKHAAKQAAREEWLGTHGDLKGWNPAKAEGIYSRGTMATYIGVASRFAGFAAECGAKRINDLTEQMGADYLCAMHAQGQSAWSIATAAVRGTLCGVASPASMTIEIFPTTPIRCWWPVQQASVASPCWSLGLWIVCGTAMA